MLSTEHEEQDIELLRQKAIVLMHTYCMERNCNERIACERAGINYSVWRQTKCGSRPPNLKMLVRLARTFNAIVEIVHDGQPIVVIMDSPNARRTEIP